MAGTTTLEPGRGLSGYRLAAVVLPAALHAGRPRRGRRTLCGGGAAFRR
jgi:hypothetical protein